MKKLLIFISIFSLVIGSVPVPAFAQNLATPSATLAPQETPTPTPANIELVPPIENNVFENLAPQDSNLAPTISNNQNAQASASFGLPIRVHQLSKKNFKGDEKITIIVENTTVPDLQISLFDVDGNNVGVKYEQISSESPAAIRLIPPNQFKAGRYRLVITDSSGNTTTQDFTWGVLAINPNKSIYNPNETANIAMAVLDETGEMVCDANVKLNIKNEILNIDDELSTDNGKIKVNPECSLKNFTLTPDYEASYQVGGLGTYNLTLTAKTKNGTYSEDDSFQVSNTAAFDVERVNATRLYPPLTYPSVFNITANQDFQGTITERVPDTFAVSQLGGGTDPFDIASSSADFSNITSDASSSAIPNLSLPFDGNYAISQKFGQELSDPIEGKKYADFGLIGHDGVDFDLPEGTPVLAADTGVVIMADTNGPYGTTIVLQHSWGRSYYGHLSFMTSSVGETILRGHPMGMSGSTGLSTGPHLHFGIKPTNNNPSNGYYGKINPLPYLGLEGFNGPNSNVFYSTANSYNYGEKLLSWDVNLKKGDKIKLGYNYKAPNVSPQFYLLGSLEFRASGSSDLVFQEQRQWQLAVDANGSGTNTVNPTAGTVSTTGNTYTFTFTAAETMDSGGIKITVPSGWTAPQGTAGTAGYTTAVGNGTATVANVLTNADAEVPADGSWLENDQDMCGSATTLNAATDIVVDTTNKQEGTGSIQCASAGTASDSTDSWGFIYNANQNWSTACNGGACTDIAFWVRPAVAGTAGQAEFAWSSTTDVQGGRIAACTLPTLTNTTWTYVKCALSGTLTTVRSYGFICIGTGNACAPFEGGVVNIDEPLIGPGVPAFSGAGPWDIDFRILDAANTQTITVTYGSGGGTSGVTNSATAGVHTFTTKSRISTTGTLTNISSHPTVTLASLNQLMRHGKFLQNGVEQPFTF